MNPETNLSNSIRLALSSVKTLRLFRNNVGKFMFRCRKCRTQLVCHKCGHVDRTVLVYGLGVGSSDNVGWDSITITQQMVGTKIAQFVALEIKTDTGIIAEAQQHFVDFVNAAGGKAAIVNSEQGATEFFTK